MHGKWGGDRQAYLSHRSAIQKIGGGRAARSCSGQVNRFEAREPTSHCVCRVERERFLHDPFVLKASPGGAPHLRGYIACDGVDSASSAGTASLIMDGALSTSCAEQVLLMEPRKEEGG